MINIDQMSEETQNPNGCPKCNAEIEPYYKHKGDTFTYYSCSKCHWTCETEEREDLEKKLATANELIEDWLNGDMYGNACDSDPCQWCIEATEHLNGGRENE